MFSPKSSADCSYRYHHRLEVFFRNRLSVFLERQDKSFNCFFDVGNGFLLCFTLTDAAGKTGTLRNPVTIFAGINDDLSSDSFVQV